MNGPINEEGYEEVTIFINYFSVLTVRKIAVLLANVDGVTFLYSFSLITKSCSKCDEINCNIRLCPSPCHGDKGGKFVDGEPVLPALKDENSV